MCVQNKPFRQVMQLLQKELNYFGFLAHFTPLFVFCDTPCIISSDSFGRSVTAAASECSKSPIVKLEAR